MGLKLFAAGFCAAVIAVTAFAAIPAQAAQKKKRVVTETQQQRVVTTRPRARVVATTRPRARVIVRNRSFLDPGTESLPGEAHDQFDYAFPPGQYPGGVIDNTAFNRRGPLPGPFDLPSQNNPWPWNR